MTKIMHNFYIVLCKLYENRHLRSNFCDCREELPVLLTLPRILKEAESRQALSSLALLGKGKYS